MNWLRLILLTGGLLLIAVLVWLERRRPSRVLPETDFRTERSEPALGFADDEEPRAGPRSESRASSAPGPDADDEAVMLMSARGPDPPSVDMGAT